MTPSPSHPRRTALIAGIAGAAVLGAVAVGTTAAFAAGAPTPSPTASAGVRPGADGPGPVAPGGDGPRGTHAPHIGGIVTAVSGSTVTVKDHDGFTRTIRLASGATVTKDGDTSTISAITKGAHIEATGTVDANGTTLDATAVRLGDPKPGAAPKPGDTGPLGKGPHGGRAAGGPAAPGSATSPSVTPSPSS